MNIKNHFPIVQSFVQHTARDWRKDVIAGITVAVMLVPQGMAYAKLAGMPHIYGLYAGLVPLFLYAILGTSRQMSIGPVAISALLVLAGVSQVADPMTSEYVGYVILTGLLIGIVQVLLGLFRLGFLVNFISHPVIIGFTSAAAIIIVISQLEDLLGFEIPRFAHAYETVEFAIQNMAQTNWITVVMCLGAILVMLLLRRISKSIPGPLIVVVIGTLLVYFLGENVMTIEIVKDVPKGLPAFEMPTITWEKIQLLLPTVATVTIIGIVESIGIAKVLQSKHGNYQINPDQELIALGTSKIGGSFFQALPTSGSFTRSAVNNEAGARSGFASIFTAILIGLTLLFLTPLFYYLPKAILAAIILLSVKSLFEWEEAKHLWRAHRQDFYMMLTTFIVTLVIGIEMGVLVGVVLSIAMILYKSAKPHYAVLGKLPGSINYRNIYRFEHATPPEGILIIRFDEQLYFGNAVYFQNTVQDAVLKHESGFQLFVLDASSMHAIDSTGIHALKDVHQFLERRGIKFYISGMLGKVRDKAIKDGLINVLGEKTQFLNIHQAVVHFQNECKGIETQWSIDAIQSNNGDD